MEKRAFTDSFFRAMYFSLTFHVIISVIFFLVILDILSKGGSYFNHLGVYLAITITAFLSLCFWFNKSFKEPVLRHFGLMGGLAVAPVLLFIFSVPATIYFITGGLQISVADWSLLGIVTASLVVFCASMVVFTLPVDNILSENFSKSSQNSVSVLMIMLFIIIIAGLTLALVEVVSRKFEIPLFSFYLILPLLSVLIVVSAATRLRRMKKDIFSKIKSFKPEKITPVFDGEAAEVRVKSSIYNELLFRENYFPLITGDNRSLLKSGSDTFAESVIYFAGRNYDLALFPALEFIASEEKHSEVVRHKAAGTIYNIEKYYSNPGKNIDMIVQEGISEKAAAARKIASNQRKPQISEIIKLIGEEDPELRRIALAAIGKFNIGELWSDVILALSNTDTEKEAYYLIKFLGSDIYNELSQSFASTVENERVSMLKIRLLARLSSSAVINDIDPTFWQGAVRMKSQGIKYLKRANLTVSADDKNIYKTQLSGVLFNISQILSFEYAAKARKCFGLAMALKQERLVNISLAFDLLSFITDDKTSSYLRKQIESKNRMTRKYAAEVVSVIIDDQLKGPVLALIDQARPEKMLEKLRYYYSIREPRDSNIVSLILNSDQNISGAWVKACVLRCVSEGKLIAGSDLLISYLFSSNQLLQEEAARALRRTKPEAFAAVSHRIPQASAAIIRDVFENKSNTVSLIYEKTRFLSLCFGNIPEERLIPLAKKMRYSDAGDSRRMPGLISWIIPVEAGKSGLYSITMGEISDFVFHNPEFLDILIIYIEKAMKENVN